MMAAAGQSQTRAAVRAAALLCLLLEAVVYQGGVDGAVDCTSVRSQLAQCLAYVTSTTASSPPSTPCCDGVKAVSGVAQTVDDRRAICSCIKSYVDSANIQTNAAAVTALPSACGVSLSFTVPASQNCNDVN